MVERQNVLTWYARWRVMHECKTDGQKCEIAKVLCVKDERAFVTTPTHLGQGWLHVKRAVLAATSKLLDV